MYVLSTLNLTVTFKCMMHNFMIAVRPTRFIVCILLFLLIVIDVPLCSSKDRVIKTYSDPTVYLLKNGTKHVIPDWDTFLSLGYDINNLKTLDDAVMMSYPLGEPVSVVKVEATLQNPYKDCPCVSQAKYYESTVKSISKRSNMLCFIDNDEYRYFIGPFNETTTNNDSSSSSNKLPFRYRTITPEVLLHSKLNFTSIYEKDEVKDCEVVINIVDDSLPIDKYVCPESCKPVPYTEVKLSWLLFNAADAFNSTDGITCSMTFSELYKDREFIHLYNISKDLNMASDEMYNYNNNNNNHHHHHHRYRNHYQHRNNSYIIHSPKTVGALLKIISQRRFEECNEQHLWPTVTIGNRTHPKTTPPRQVFGLIIWVGSRSRLSLLHQQIKILSNQSVDADKRIMGWMATEDQYDCRPGSTICYSNSPQYHPHLPTTRLNVAASGWACAQRRVLRSLQHTLLLFDPQFMIICDDDTYVNINKLEHGGLLDKFIRKTLVKSNYVLGELTMGKKITRKGFYYGGAGYFFGRKIITELQGYRIKGPFTPSDDMRDATQMAQLSLFKQVVAESTANTHCKSCATVDVKNMSNSNGVQSRSITVRLIDICVNIMAQEHTCYHSDHSMSRCLLHGSHGYPVSIICGGSDIGNNLLVGMCMDPGDSCGPVQLTCHRYYARQDDPRIAKGIYDPR